LQPTGQVVVVIKKNLVNDLKLFAGLFFLIVAIWIFLSEHSWEMFIGKNDAASIFVWYLRELQTKGLDQLAYNPILLGGFPVGLSLGLMWPLMLVLKVFKLDPFIMHNLHLWWLQSTIAYFAVKWTWLWLPSSYQQEKSLQKNLETFLVITLVAFSPLLGWRFAYGHVNLILGAASFITCLYLFQALACRKLSLLDYFLAFVALSLTINFVSFQPIMHIMYLLPIILLLLYGPQKLRQMKFSIVLIFILVFILVNAYFMLPFYSFYLLGDAARGSAIDIFAYAPFNLKAWIATFLPENSWVDLDPIFFTWHELHYPIGLGYLSLLLIRKRSHQLMTAILLILVFGFILNLTGISPLVQLLPMMNKFLVPQRILILLGLLGSMGAGLWMIGRVPRCELNRQNALYVILSILVGMTIPLYLRGQFDLLLVIILALFLFAAYKRLSLLALCSLLLIGFINIGAFFSHFMPPVEAKALRQFSQMGKPEELTNPFERAFLGFGHELIHKNTGWVLNISSLDGYFYATTRFSQLIHAIHERPYYATSLDWKFNASGPQALLLSKLFNIKYDVNLSQQGWNIKTLDLPHAGIIFPSAIIIEDQVERIAAHLKEDWSRVMVAGQYQELVKALAGCQNGSLNSQYDSKFQGLKISGQVARDCLIVIPTNYSRYLTFSSGESAARTLPVNHALLGIILPAGVVDGHLVPSYSIFP
jgi:hypothetical protein